jgi:hypothetical protein
MGCHVDAYLSALRLLTALVMVSPATGIIGLAPVSMTASRIQREAGVLPAAVDDRANRPC